MANYASHTGRVTLSSPVSQSDLPRSHPDIPGRNQWTVDEEGHLVPLMDECRSDDLLPWLRVIRETLLTPRGITVQSCNVRWESHEDHDDFGCLFLLDGEVVRVPGYRHWPRDPNAPFPEGDTIWYTGYLEMLNG